MDVFLLVVAVAVCVGLVYLGYRIEPHHVSKSGTRFLCTGQWISAEGDTDGRKREVWVSVLPDGQLAVDVKKRMHHDVTMWTLEGKAPTPPPKRAVYVMRSIHPEYGTQRMTIKMPAKSRAVPILDAMLPTPKL